MTSTQGSQKKPRASGGWFLGRLGGGSRGANVSPAEQALKSAQADLPETDPLRRARVQTARFIAQLPSSPLAEKDKSGEAQQVPEPQTGVQENLASPKKGQAPAPTTPPMPADISKNKEPVKDEAAAKTDTQESPALKELRAEKQERARGAAREASSRSRRRIDELRAEHRANRPRAVSAPAHSAATSRLVSAPARAAAERTPARVALPSVGPERVPPKKPRPKGNTMGRSINALVLLVMLLVFALLGALLWYGYGWYQGLLTQQEGATTIAPVVPIDTPLQEEPASESIAIPTGQNESAQESTAIPAPEPEAPPLEETDATAPLSSEAIREAAYQDAVLLLERELAQAFFLDLGLVDGAYTLETQEALVKFAETTNLEGLKWEVLTAGLNTTREELERWLAQIQPIAESF